MSEAMLILIFTVLAGLLMILLGLSYRDNRRIREREQELGSELGQLRHHMSELVARHVEQWKQREFEGLIVQQRELARREARTLLLQWRTEAIEQIRKEAISKSQSVTLGKVVEHIAPFFPVFPFNPKDARFIGSPVDFIVFDGASQGDVHRIVLLEVKSGGSTLTTKQRRIRDAVRDGRVEWHELRAAEDGAA